MNLQRSVLLLFGTALAALVYFILAEVLWVTTLLSPLPLSSQLPLLVVGAGLAGFGAGRTMAACWRYACLRSGSRWPPQLSVWLVGGWTSLGLVPPFFPSQEKPVLMLATALSLWALYALRDSHHPPP